MNYKEIENSILANRGDSAFLGNIIAELSAIKQKYDWQLNTFLTTKCAGAKGIKSTDLDSNDPLYRYYNYKCGQYEQVERMIRVAKAFQ